MEERLKLLASAAVSVLPNIIKIPVYRHLFGARIESGVKIGFACVLAADDIQIGKHTHLGPFNFIRAREFHAGKHVQIGSLTTISVDTIELSSRAIVGSLVEILGDRWDEQSRIRLGMHSWIFPHCYVNVVRPVSLGRNVGVGGGTYIFTHGYWLSALDGFPVKYGPVTIGNDTWLPWGCFIMPDVEVGDRVIVGARSVVNKSVPSDALIAGIPAKVIRDRSSRDVELPEKLSMLRDVTRSFAAYRKRPHQVQLKDGRELHSVDGQGIVALYGTAASGAGSLMRDVLNVLPGPLDKELACERPCFFLEDSGSSSYEAIPERGREWLTFARRIGLRFYPWDEE